VCGEVPGATYGRFGEFSGVIGVIGVLIGGVALEIKLLT
jgi:hypothetical protein